MESTTIVCDRCNERTDKASRTKLRWGRESGVPGSTFDLCGECSEWLAQRLGLVPESLPFGPPDLAENGRA